MTALSDLLRDSGVDPARAIERISQSAEHSMDRATVYRYLDGRHPGRPSERYLSALAHGFQLKITDVRMAANVRPGELGEWNPPDESGQLSKPIRDALDALIITIAKGGIEHGERSAQKSPDRVTEYDPHHQERRVDSVPRSDPGLQD